MKSSSGQVAIILILVVAIALIFYAVSLNFGKISQVKTMTTIASNQAAGLLASQMASYGQQMFEVQLGGQGSVCGWTAVVAAIITVIIVIISFITQQYQYIVLAFFVMAVAVTNLVLQIAVVQPGITEMWNDIKADTLSISESFLENGIGTGLSGMITDNKRVPDFEDLDRDGLFGLDADGEPLDTISRYAVYYTWRLKQAIDFSQEGAIEAFQTALKELLFEETEGDDGWALFDPNVSCTDSQCNPCCVPQYQTDINGNQLSDSDGNLIPLRPGDCEGTDDEIRTACLAKSLYYLDSSNEYPWVYDPYLEQSDNGFTSFRELLGKDDEHKDYNKNPSNPNGTQSAATVSEFVLKDAEGYYVSPYYTSSETRQSIAPFFYKVADWGVDLNNLDTDVNPEECHWCSLYSGITCPADQPAEILQWAPLSNPTVIPFETYCVDGTDANLATYPPRATDKVTLPEGILAADDACAQNAFDDLSLGLGFWKRGGDRFCSTEYPYAENCEKNKYSSTTGWCNDNTEACTCAASDTPELWPDDEINDIYYGIPDFVLDTNLIVNRDINELAGDFDLWYPDIARWIEQTAGVCFVCDDKQGYLWQWLEAIRTMIERLEVFRDNNYSGSNCDAASGGDPNAVWCVPPSQPGSPNSYGLNECRSVTPAEAATFDSNGNSIRGDLEDVTACLTWNVEDGGGNAAKFDACTSASCNASVRNCFDLPRSLYSDFDTSLWRPGVYDTEVKSQEDLDLLQKCLKGCSNSTCKAIPWLTGFPSDPADYDFGDGNMTDSCADWGGGNTWFDLIAAQIALACDDASWFSSVQVSANYAEVQVDKFRKRRDFLQGRLTELYGMIVPASDFRLLEDCRKDCNDLNCQSMNPIYFTPFGLDLSAVNFDAGDTCFSTVWPRTEFYDRIQKTGVLTRAYDKLDDFLNGPARALIQARIDLGDSPSGLPYHAIYAWQSDPPDGPDGRVGYWHIVRVDARTPGRCDGACNSEGDPIGGDPTWPRVTSERVNYGMTRCYSMADTEGMVKVRVTRFDEDRDASRITFPNGVPIWDFRMFHPDRASAYSDTSNLYADCTTSMIPDPPCDPLAGICSYNHFGGAFMLNERIDSNPSAGESGNLKCWRRVNNLLTRGVTSETCARYYFHGKGGEAGEGMGIEFVPCPEF